MLNGALLVWSGAVAATSAWAVARSRRPVRRASVAPGRVLLVRPCAGYQPWLPRTLGSSAAAHPRLSAAVRFAVAHPGDGAADVARAVASGLVRAGIDAGVDFTHPDGQNRKAAQLDRVLEDEPHAEIVIVADSDVDLDEEVLEALLVPLQFDPGVAASWAIPIEVEPVTFGDRASASVLDASLHSFALLSALDHQGMVGKLFAVRTARLREVGGFGALSNTLGEDVELARRLRARGFIVALAASPARSLARGRSWGDARGRYARWIHVMRGQRPLLLPSYPALLAATPLLVVAGVLGSLCGGWGGVLAATIACLARLAVAIAARWRTGRPMAPGALAGDAVLADLLLLSAFVQALSSHRTTWRGRILRHTGRGRIQEVRH
jgi:ceramide glucosyltransferase